MKLKLFKLHYIYNFNKPIIYISLLIIVLSVILFSMTGKNIYEQNDNGIPVYNELIESFVKIITIFITIMIMSNSFISENDNYKIFVLNNDITKNTFLVTKIIILLFYIICLVISEFIISSCISIIIFKKISFDLFIAYKEIILVNILFDSLTLLVITMFDYFYLSIILFIFYLIVDNTSLINTIMNDMCIYTLLVILLFGFSIYIYNTKDTKI